MGTKYLNFLGSPSQIEEIKRTIYKFDLKIFILDQKNICFALTTIEVKVEGDLREIKKLIKLFEK